MGTRDNETIIEEKSMAAKPFVFRFAKEIEGTIDDLQETVATNGQETLPPPID